MQAEGFECFLDRKSFEKGDNWRIAARRALARTQRLVLLVSPACLNSEPVKDDLQYFKGHKKRVISIDIGHLEHLEGSKSPIFAFIESDELWIPESPKVIDTNNKDASHIPSKHIIQDLSNTFVLERQNKKRLRWVTRISGILFGLIVVAVAMYFVAECQRDIAEVNEGLARENEEQAITNAETTQKNAGQTSRELANAEAILAGIARDRDSNVIEAGHRYLRAAQAAQKAEDMKLVKSYQIAARSLVDFIQLSFPHDGAVSGAESDSNEKRLLT